MTLVNGASFSDARVISARLKKRRPLLCWRQQSIDLDTDRAERSLSNWSFKAFTVGRDSIYWRIICWSANTLTSNG